MEKARPDFQAALEQERLEDDEREANAAAAAADGQQQHVLPPSADAVVRLMRPDGKKVRPYSGSEMRCASDCGCGLTHRFCQVHRDDQFCWCAGGDIVDGAWPWVSGSVPAFQANPAGPSLMAGGSIVERRRLLAAIHSTRHKE